ncbi:GDSL-type esterase/lipase family protein [Aquimarina sp. 2201CG1-2-11]|uniref:SGNH/GDSL hydrolase family protein n=1 Tax=Aquimarina discodermiae TaxID=3231043 RepID=UPI003461A233
MKHIICFGDSITRGENDTEKGGWVDRLKTHCIKKFLKTRNNEICVFNMGIGGETTEGLKKRFVHEFTTRLIENGDNIVTFAYGANDIALSNNKNTISVEEFYSNLVFCIDVALRKKATVYLINILPFIESVDSEYHDQRKLRNIEDIITYNTKILEISKEKQIHHIDLFQTMKVTQNNWFTYDGVHPNSKGHQRIYKKIKNVIFNPEL